MQKVNFFDFIRSHQDREASDVIQKKDKLIQLQEALDEARENDQVNQGVQDCCIRDKVTNSDVRVGQPLKASQMLKLLEAEKAAMALVIPRNSCVFVIVCVINHD